MTRDKTKEILMMIQAAYPNFKVPDKTITINTWHLVLEKYPYDLIKGALVGYITTDKSGFAPVIGQILEIVESMTSEQSLDEMSAWSLVSKALRNGNYHAREEFEKLPRVVQQAVGSPDNLKNWSTSDYESIETVIQSNFLRTYRTCVERDKKLNCMPDLVRNSIEENIPSLNLPERREPIGIETRPHQKMSEETKRKLAEFRNNF